MFDYEYVDKRGRPTSLPPIDRNTHHASKPTVPIFLKYEVRGENMHVMSQWGQVLLGAADGIFAGVKLRFMGRVSKIIKRIHEYSITWLLCDFSYVV